MGQLHKHVQASSIRDYSPHSFFLIELLINVIFGAPPNIFLCTLGYSENPSLSISPGIQNTGFYFTQPTNCSNSIKLKIVLHLTSDFVIVHPSSMISMSNCVPFPHKEQH